MAGVIDQLRSGVRAAASWVGAVVGEAVPETGATPATPTTQEPLTTTTVAALRAMLDEHDRGIFLRSALLADLMRRDADVVGALTQRLLAFQALDVDVEPPNTAAASEAEVAAADAAVESYESERDAIVSPGAQVDMLVDGAMLGFALGQLVWTFDADLGRLTQRLEPWPAHAVEYNRIERQWYAFTADQRRLPVTPGDGQWVLYTPRGHRAPWLWGAIRSTAEWYLRDSEVAADGSRRSEVFGNAIWKAKLPSGGRKTPDGKTFTGSLRTMGRNAVIPCPQGATPNESYDVELVEAKSDAHQIFEWMLRTGGGRIRLALLGQDLTSQNNLIGTNASSETGMTTLDRIVRAEGKAWGHCETAQIVAPRARYLGEPAVRVCIEVEEQDDRKTNADAQKATADAAQSWRALGVNVDVEAMAAKAGVPVLASTTSTEGTP